VNRGRVGLVETPAVWPVVVLELRTPQSIRAIALPRRERSGSLSCRGGGIGGSDLLAHELHRLERRAPKPVILGNKTQESVNKITEDNDKGRIEG